MEFAGTQRQTQMFEGEAVFSANGEKVGEVEKVLYDKATGEPEWIAVQTGLLGLKSRLAPFHGAEHRTEGVVVPHSASQIEAAPELEGDEVSQGLERQLASHYGVAYSESRSQTGLAQGQTSRAAGRGRQRPQSRAKQSTPRRRTTRTSRRSEGPTRDELYAQAQRLGIEGRSKMNKAQLERAVGRQGGRAPSEGKASPFEVQKFLEAVGYPASKRDLVREAKDQGADVSVRSTLERLPDEDFDSPAAVSKAISNA
jgi:hypothetical protein